MRVDGFSAFKVFREITLAPPTYPPFPKLLPNVAVLRDECRRGAGVLLLTEDALSPKTVEILHDLLGTQPLWSDLAVIICATQGDVIEGRLGAIEKLRATANVSLLERPVRRWMLGTSLVAAVRARRRQYEMRDLYQERSAVLEREKIARSNAESANRSRYSSTDMQTVAASTK